MVLVTLLFFPELSYCMVMALCMCLRFSLHFSGVMSGSEVVMLVCSLLWKFVALMFLGRSEYALRSYKRCVCVCIWVSCLSWVASSLRWVSNGRTLVSSCRCWVFVSCVHPVAICKAVFWMVFSFLMLVFDMIGLHMVFAYFKMECVIALYVETINSFCLPYLVKKSAFRMLGICFALVMVTLICCENVNFGYRMIHNFFWVIHKW